MNYEDILKAAESLTLSEINDLVNDLEDLRETKSRDAEQKLIEEMNEKAAELGLSMDRILVQAKGTGTRGKKSVALYQNKDNPKQTWAGKGRKPAWLQEALAAGKSLADFKI